MITNITVLSRMEMSDIKDKLGVNDLVISINDSATGVYNWCDGPLFEDTSPKILSLFFHDIEEERIPYIAFNEDHAESIAVFVKYWHKRRIKYNLYVHCFAGISRSGAVGRVISEYIGINEEFEAAHKHIIPNCRIMRYLRPILGLTYRSQK